MNDSRIPRRAFEALFRRFSEAVQKHAQSKQYKVHDYSAHELGYLTGFMIMEFSVLPEDAQVQLYDHMDKEIVRLRQEAMTIDLQANKKEISF